MSTENKSIVRRYTEEVWNKGNFAVADETVAKNVVDHDEVNPSKAGLEGFKAKVTRPRTAFPDVHFTIDEILGDDDKVVSRWTARGTHKGDFLGLPATGKQARVTGISITRLSGGKIVEHWANWGALDLMRQLRAFPVVAPAGRQSALV